MVVGAGGAVGAWFGGVASDWLRRRDIRWSLWIVAVMLAVTKPFNFGFLLSHDTSAAMLWFIIPGIAGAIYIGPSLAVLHNRVPAELRPIASAVFLLTVNFIGLGVGPLLVGGMSQYAFSEFGTDALRYALVVAQLVAFWAAFHYYLAGSVLGSTSDQTAPSANAEHNRQMAQS